jgi:hypothetical protein
LAPPSSPARAQFFVHERQPELLARHMLLLAVATDWELPPRQRAALWLEIFGNAKVQGRTAAYVSRLRLPLISVLTGGGGPAPLPALLDAFSHLRHKQRDEVEAALKTWDAALAYDVGLYRDTRLRHHLGVRYDARDNVADWDYNAVVKPCAGGVHSRQYREWRNTGVAFEYGDCVYDAPNRSMGSFADARERRRGSIQARGFWADTAVSPFHAVGTAAYVPTDEECAAAALAAGGGGSAGARGARGNAAFCLFDVLNRRHGSEQWRHHAVEVATYNVLAWLHEIETGRMYVMAKENDIYSGLAAAGAPAPAAAAAAAATEGGSGGGGGGEGEGAGAGEGEGGPPPAPAAPPAAPPAVLTPEEAAAVAATLHASAAARARTIARAFKSVTVSFLGGDFAVDFLEKGKLRGAFHALAVSGRAAHLVGKPFFRALAARSAC